MSKETTRIMVLGVVASRGPISGYGIEKTLEEWAVQRWTTIAPASIYQQLRSLTTAGLIEPATERSGRATDYACTDAGRRRLRELLLALLHEPSPQPLSLIPLLHFTPSLNRDELVDGLQGRITRLDEALGYESQVLDRAAGSGPLHVAEIFRLTWEGLRADRAWCLDYLRRLGA
ncbi:MAG TPA: PadR family transcriptional regulator [Gryllotalpicola sp.]